MVRILLWAYSVYREPALVNAISTMGSVSWMTMEVVAYSRPFFRGKFQMQPSSGRVVLLTSIRVWVGEGGREEE